MKLRNTLIATAVAVASAFSAIAAEQSPKYIFYYIGDGMGMGPVMATQAYNRLVRADSVQLTMTQFPVVSWCQTYSYSTPVTDSAAAGTALATGTKTRNGMLGMAPDTTAVNSVARILKDDGYGVGIITTVSPDDATPGAFYAHVPSRSMYYEIGKQMASCGYDFIAGAGLRGLKDKEGNPTDLLEVFAQNNVHVAHGIEQLSGVAAEKVLLLNKEGTEPNNVGYTIDSIPNNLTLPIITQACLNQLERNSPDRFFMMVEGGNIDHALHGNDGGAAIKEVINFDQALEIAYKFYLAHPDETLIVVTADHDTGGMAIGNTTRKYEASLEYFDSQKVSKEAFSKYCKGILNSRRIFTWDDMRRYLTENLGFWKAVPITEQQTKTLEEKFNDTFEMRNSADQKTLYASFNNFAVEVFKVLNDQAGIGFTTTSHTGNPVPVFAIGVGAEKFIHLNNNKNLPALILQTVGKTLK